MWGLRDKPAQNWIVMNLIFCFNSWLEDWMIKRLNKHCLFKRKNNCNSSGHSKILPKWLIIIRILNLNNNCIVLVISTALVGRIRNSSNKCNSNKMHKWKRLINLYLKKKMRSNKMMSLKLKPKKYLENWVGNSLINGLISMSWLLGN